MEITVLTDYQGFFGSKWNSMPYRSGYDQNLLQTLFAKHGVQLRFMRFSQVQFEPDDWNGRYVLYTSNEDPGYHYKSYMEDVAYYLKLRGAVLIPPFEMLRANNNKVFMELYRRHVFGDRLEIIPAIEFGALEDLLPHEDQISYPCVLKVAAGAMSRGVRLVKSKDELLKTVKEMCHTGSTKQTLVEKVRIHKHRGYAPISSYQQKFILQRFVSDLKNDWKVLIYGNQVYILKRHIREGDFRASGSHMDYRPGSQAGFPLDILDSLMDFMHTMDVPNISLDVAYDGKKGYIFEYQCIYFGTSTQYKSPDYYQKEGNSWVVRPTTMNQEEVYVWSIVHFLNQKGLLESTPQL